MSEPIMAFVSVRPPQLAEPQDLGVRSTADPDPGASTFLAMVNAVALQDRRTQSVVLAKDYFATNRYVLSTTREADLNSLLAALRAAGKPSDVDLNMIRAQWERDLWDSIYAHSLVPEFRPEGRERLFEAAKHIHRLRLLLQGDAGAGGGLERTAIAVPADLFAPIVVDREQESSLSDVIDELAVAGEKLSLLEEARVEIDAHSRLLAAEARTTTFQEQMIDGGAGAGTEQKAITVLQGSPRVATLDPDNMNLGENTKRVLREGLSLKQDDRVDMPAFDAVDAVARRINASVMRRLRGLPRHQLEKLTAAPQIQKLLDTVPVPFLEVAGTRGVGSQNPEATLRPLGIGDLLVVKQYPLRYEEGEVAHIENVLASESRNRKHRRLRQREEERTIETEDINEEEEDLQKTERNEMAREIERTLQSEQKTEAGLKITASYGAVTVSANADFASKTARSSSFRSASTFAKEVTERSRTRIVKRVREERRTRVLDEIEETNEHGFNNEKGRNICGIYRWVDKVYRNRIINYGRRLMFEFVVPEPSAVFRFHQETSKSAVVPAPRPPAVSSGSGTRPLRPSDLTEANYMEFVSEYGAQDVEPFPSYLVTIAASVADKNDNGGNKPIGKADATFKVPDGYEARSWGGIWSWVYIANNTYVPLTVHIGGRDAATGFYLPNITGSIHFGVIGCVLSYSVNAVIHCQRRQEKMQAWQLDTFQKIMEAYARKLEIYREAIAAAEVAQGLVIVGRNPELNRAIEKEELERACLRLLTDDFARTRVSGTWRLDEKFDAMKSAMTGHPDFDISEAIVEGKIIQFFEQAFEWNNVTYMFYPYFWGREEKWQTYSNSSDVDPKFTEFLKAGSARVVVPVRPAYGELVLHYLKTREIWNGGEPPVITDPEYVSIVDELRDADLQGEMGVIVSEWDVKLPTDLVKLQKDDLLPQFKPPQPPATSIVLTGFRTWGDLRGVAFSANRDLPAGDWTLKIDGNERRNSNLRRPNQWISFLWPDRQEWLATLDRSTVVLRNATARIDVDFVKE